MSRSTGGSSPLELSRPTGATDPHDPGRPGGCNSTARVTAKVNRIAPDQKFRGVGGVSSGTAVSLEGRLSTSSAGESHRWLPGRQGGSGRPGFPAPWTQDAGGHLTIAGDHRRPQTVARAEIRQIPRELEARTRLPDVPGSPGFACSPPGAPRPSGAHPKFDHLASASDRRSGRATWWVRLVA